jgi:hypothetical protein
MKYLYNGHLFRAIDPKFLPLAEIIYEPDDLAPATQAPAAQLPLMQLPKTALRAMKIRGHAARPGTGPAGECCGSCSSLVRREGGARRFFKCRLTKAKWTQGTGTDVRQKDPACIRWAAT